MKILHTADWHIGKVLHKHSLEDEICLFFEWLLETIQSQSIDILLISGDIFDRANPSTSDQGIYFDFLSRLIPLKIQVIITGGNHDSVGFLNAPKDILSKLKISIIGGACKNIEDELVLVKDSKGSNKMVVAAIPYLRDKDLRNSNTDEKFETRTEAIRYGIKKHYKEAGDLCAELYPNLPAIAMGHLYASGASTSESERDIQMGNEASIDASIFPSIFSYVALGHIHQPQIVAQNETIRYSGSPIALSFSEKKDVKSVITIELIDGSFNNPKTVKIPKFRELKRFKGRLAEIKKELDAYSPQFKLTSFVEIIVQEEKYDPATIAAVENIKTSFEESQHFKILKGKSEFKNTIKDTSQLFNHTRQINEIKPSDVFDKLIEKQLEDTADAQLLKDAFQELLEAYQSAN